MKKLKFIVFTILITSLFLSCEKDTKDVELIKDGDNIVIFENNAQVVTNIAETGEHSFDVMVKLTGPTFAEMTEDVTLTVGVDTEASDAEEGVHYRLDNTKLVLKQSENYIGLFTVTMLTDGVPSPLAKHLILKITDAQGGKVVASGKETDIKLSYACPSDLAGTYNVVTIYTDYDGNVSTLNWTEDITETGIGEYRTGRVGHWDPATLGGTPGYTFYDVCGEITIPGQYLADYWANWVQGTEPGAVDENTGVITVKYSVCYPQGSDHCRYYESTYTPAK